MNYLLITSVLAVVLAMFSTAATAKEETAIFGGGCFWCMEKPFEELDGVIDVVSGYTGGTSTKPNYQKKKANPWP